MTTFQKPIGSIYRFDKDSIDVGIEAHIIKAVDGMPSIKICVSVFSEAYRENTCQAMASIEISFTGLQTILEWASQP